MLRNDKSEVEHLVVLLKKRSGSAPAGLISNSMSHTVDCRIFLLPKRLLLDQGSEALHQRIWDALEKKFSDGCEPAFATNPVKNGPDVAVFDHAHDISAKKHGVPRSDLF